MKCSKEEFDLQARRLMSPETIHLHNQFFLAILARCQTLVTPVTTSTLTSTAKQSGYQHDGIVSANRSGGEISAASAVGASAATGNAGNASLLVANDTTTRDSGS